MTHIPIPDPRRQVVLFATRWGKYLITRAEREVLARLHGATPAQAHAIAWRGAELPEGPAAQVVAAHRGGTCSAHALARLFDANGDPRPGVEPLPGLYPQARALPRIVDTARAGS